MKEAYLVLVSSLILLASLSFVSSLDYSCSQNSDCKINVCSIVCVNSSFITPPGVGCSYPPSMLPKNCICIGNVCVNSSLNNATTSSGGGGGTVVSPNASNITSECEKFYNCPNGKKVQYCLITQNENGAGCGCKNYTQLCENDSSSGCKNLYWFDNVTYHVSFYN